MRSGLLAVVVLVFLSVPIQADDADLTIERLSITARGNVRIVARFDPDDVPRDLDLWRDGGAVRLDGQPIAEFGGSPRGPTELPGFALLHREKTPNLRRVKLDLGEGRLVVRAKRLPRPVVGFSEVVVSLRLGERTLTACVKTQTKGRRAKYRGERAPKPGADLAFETLAERSSMSMDAGACGVAVLRDADSLAELCADLGRNPPEVDFETDMVVLMRLGFRSEGDWVEVLRVRERGEGTHVVLRQSRSVGRCAIIAVANSPYAMVRLARRDGPVTVGVKIRTHRCR